MKDNTGQFVIAGIIILVMILLFAMCSSGGSGSSSGSSRKSGLCSVCGKETTMKIDGRYYCYKHYNQRLAGN